MQLFWQVHNKNKMCTKHPEYSWSPPFNWNIKSNKCFFYVLSAQSWTYIQRGQLFFAMITNKPFNHLIKHNFPKFSFAKCSDEIIGCRTVVR